MDDKGKIYNTRQKNFILKFISFFFSFYIKSLLSFKTFELIHYLKHESKIYIKSHLYLIHIYTHNKKMSSIN